MAERMTSFLCPEDIWLMMERLVNHHKETGQGRYKSKQQVMLEALERLRPELKAEYTRVFGANPPSGG